MTHVKNTFPMLKSTLSMINPLFSLFVIRPKLLVSSLSMPLILTTMFKSALMVLDIRPTMPNIPSTTINPLSTIINIAPN